MSERKETRLLAIDMDNCPENDHVIIYRGLCTNCEHYEKKVEMYNGIPCVVCSFGK